MLTDAQLAKLWREIQATEDIQPMRLEEVEAIEAQYVPEPETSEQKERGDRFIRELLEAMKDES